MLSPIDEKYQRIQEWETAGGAEAARNVALALADPEPQVRGRAASALGRMRRPETVPALVARLNDEDGPTRLKAVEALGRIGDPAGIPGLVALLESAPLGRLMMGMAPADDSALSAGQLARAQGDAWDLQWAAAAALGRIGDPSAVAWVLHWAARLMLSTVRVLSIEEKAELVRGIVENLFPRLSPADIFDLSRTIHPASVSISWEPTDDGGDDYHWAAAIRDSPLHRLFKAELERRKIEYMKTLRGGADTLFNAGQPGAGGGRANSADTLFSSGGEAQAVSGGRANAADTLFSTPQSGANAADTLFQRAGDSGPALLSEYRRREDAGLGEADLDALRRMALRMSDQVEATYFPTRVAAAAGAEDPLAAETQLTVEEIQARIAAHQKTLGKSDTLFSTSHLTAGHDEDYDEGEALFLSDDQAREQQAPKRIPAARADEPTHEESPAQKMAGYQKTLGKADTLFSLAPAPSSELPSNWMDDDDLFGESPSEKPAEPALGDAGLYEDVPAPEIPVEPAPPVAVVPASAEEQWVDESVSEPNYSPEPEPEPEPAVPVNALPEPAPEPEPEPAAPVNVLPEPAPEPEPEPAAPVNVLPEQSAPEPQVEEIQSIETDATAEVAASSPPSKEALASFDAMLASMLDQLPAPAPAGTQSEIPAAPALSAGSEPDFKPEPGPPGLNETHDEFETPVFQGLTANMLLPHPIREQMKLINSRPPRLSAALPATERAKPKGRFSRLMAWARRLPGRLFRRK